MNHKSKYIEELFNEDSESLKGKAQKVQKEHFDNEIYLRGLIELTNYCSCNCNYCGIRASNSLASRYRMSKEDVLESCEIGKSLGYKTYVIQGGEDSYFNKDEVLSLIYSIKEKFPDTAITLSLGERDKDTYRAWFDAGADRYLLRHEAANNSLYGKIHPKSMSLSKRIRSLYDLKEIGYQTGTGFMVGVPGQTLDHLKTDLEFLYDFQPHMVGIGPFVPHKDTPYKDYPHGSVDLTLKLISIIRILLPRTMIPSTTSLTTIDPLGREKGILAGANVLMPNISPDQAKIKYNLYDNKSSTDEGLYKKVKAIGYKISTSRGDHVQFKI